MITMVNIGDLINGVIDFLPMPKTFFEVVWAGIGWSLASAFANINGKGLDETIQDDLSSKLDKWLKDFFGCCLHFIHHWWIGGLIMIYFGVIPIAQSLLLPISIPTYQSAEVFWFGLGLFLEDGAYHVKQSAKDGKIAKIYSLVK